MGEVFSERLLISEGCLAFLSKYQVNDLIPQIDMYINWEYYQFVKIYKYIKLVLKDIAIPNPNVGISGRPMIQFFDIIDSYALNLKYVYRKIAKMYITSYTCTFNLLLRTYKTYFLYDKADDIYINLKNIIESRNGILNWILKYTYTPDEINTMSAVLTCKIMEFLGKDEGLISKDSSLEEFCSTYSSTQYHVIGLPTITKVGAPRLNTDISKYCEKNNISEDDYFLSDFSSKMFTSPYPILSIYTSIKWSPEKREQFTQEIITLLKNYSTKLNIPLIPFQ